MLGKLQFYRLRRRFTRSFSGGSVQRLGTVKVRGGKKQVIPVNSLFHLLLSPGASKRLKAPHLISLVPKTKSRRFLLAGAGFLAIMLPIVIASLFFSRKTEATWWDEGFGFRKRVDIANSTGSDLTEFQVKILVDTAALISSGKMQSDCDDIRVVAADGQVLPYWIEESGTGACNTGTTAVWANVNFIPSSGGTVYLYYGSNLANASSDGARTFPWFFDDFSSDNGSWTNLDGEITFSNGELTFTPTLTGSTNWNHHTTSGQDGITGKGGYVIEHRYKSAKLAGGTVFRYVDDNNWWGLETGYNGMIQIRGYVAGADRTPATGPHTYPINTYVQFTIKYDEANHTAAIYADGNPITSRVFTGTDIFPTTNRIGIADHRGYGPSTSDWLFVRKFASSEPTYSLATEETSPGPVAYWKFEEGSGTVTHDSTSNALNATLTSPSWATEDMCVSGKCLLLTGKSSMSVDSTDLLDTTADTTLSMWVKPLDLTGNYSLLNRSSFTSDDGYSFELRSGKPTLIINNGRAAGTVQQCNETVDANVFSHLTWTRTGSSTNKLFINGTECTYSSTISASQVSAQTTLGIGSKLLKNNMASNTDYASSGYETPTAAGCWGGDVATITYFASGGFRDQPYKLLQKTGAGDGGCFRDNHSGITIENNRSYLVSAWMKADKAVTLSGYAIDLNRIADNQYRTGVTPILNTEWQRVSWVYNSGADHAGAYHSRQIIYNDDNLPRSTYWSGFQVEDVTGTGVIDPSTNFYGYIDEVKIYRRGKTASEVKSEYSQSASQMQSRELSSLSNGLISYWKLDEAASPALDSSGRGNTATWRAGATVGGGKFGKGIVQEDGGGGYVDVPDTNNPHDMGTGNFSVAMWFKVDSLTAPEAPELLSKRDGGSFCAGSKGYHLRVGYSDEIEFYVEGTNECFEVNSANSAIQTGNWYHVLAVYDQNNGSKIYINGAQSGSTVNKVAGSTDNAGALRMGSGANGWEMDGVYDEVRIYNRALSAAEAQDLYNYAPGPVGYWKFDEGSGTSVADASGNGNSATLTNGASWREGKVGKSVQVDGSNDYVNAGNNNVFDLASTDHTFSLWFKTAQKPASGSTGFILDRFVGGSPGGGYLINMTSAGYIGFTERSDFTSGDFQLAATSTVDYADGKWHHVAAVAKPGEKKGYLYIDGILKASDTYEGNLLDRSENLTFGSDENGNSIYSFAGQIDDVRIYNYARNPTQILEDMGGNLSPNISGTTLPDPISHWKLDELSGQVINNSGSTGSQTNGSLGSTSSSESDDPTWTTANNCKVNGCTSFDGNDTLRFPNITGLGGSSFTVSGWMNVRSQPHFYSSMLMSSGAGLVFYFTQDGDEAMDLKAQIFNGTTWFQVSCQSDSKFNQWYYMTLVYDESTTSASTYLNGKRCGGPTTVTGGMNDSYTTTFFSGSYTSSYFHDGLIDELKIYNVALTESQILQDMNAGSSLNFASSSVAEESLLREGTGNGPVAEWKFDEKQGTSANDSSGNGNTGILTGPPAWDLGKIGAALLFDGINDHVDVPSTTALNPINAWSVSAWVKLKSLDITSNVGQMILNKGDWNGVNSYSLTFYSNSLRCAIGKSFAGGVDYPFSNFEVDKWYNISCTADSSGHKLYVNGKLVAQTTNSIGAVTNTNSLRIGALSINGIYSHFNGLIDHVRIYNYARTPAQIAYDYNRGAPAVHYKLDECQGSTVNDSSGAGNAATLSVGGSGSQSSIGTCQTSGTAWGNGSSGRFGSSIALDGTDDVITLPDDYVDTHSVGSACTWFYYDKASDDGTQGSLLAFSDNASVNYKHSFYVSDSGADSAMIRAVLRVNGSSNQIDYSTANDVVTRQTWQHVCFVQDGDGVDLFVNGKPTTFTSNVTGTATTATWFDDIASQAEKLTIGNIPDNVPDSFFTGKIDDFRLYTYALSPEQVATVHNEGAAMRFGE